MSRTLKRTQQKRTQQKRKQQTRKQQKQQKRKQQKRKQQTRKQQTRKQTRRQRGGNTGFLSVLQKAVVPFLFYKAQKTQQKRVIKQRKLKRQNKSHRR
tara:strand:- start:1703 stop:1996 length:294 start_codon:yes stop_codon:yes gene_type:complete